MSEKTIGPDFTLGANERQLEIFLMRDKARKRFEAMVAEHARAAKQDAQAREARSREEAAAEERALRTERNKHDFTPPWEIPMKKQREADIQAEAQRRVDVRNAIAEQELQQRQRAEQDAFIAQQREERLQREAVERAARETPPPELKRDFERAK